LFLAILGRLGYSGLLWAMLGYPELFWAILGHLGCIWATLGYSGIFWGVWAVWAFLGCPELFCAAWADLGYSGLSGIFSFWAHLGKLEVSVRYVDLVGELVMESMPFPVHIHVQADTYITVSTAGKCRDENGNYPNYYSGAGQTDESCRSQCTSDSACIAYQILSIEPSCFIFAPSRTQAPAGDVSGKGLVSWSGIHLSRKISYTAYPNKKQQHIHCFDDLCKVHAFEGVGSYPIGLVTSF